MRVQISYFMYLSHKGRDILFPTPAPQKERYPIFRTCLITVQISYFMYLSHKGRDILFPMPAHKRRDILFSAPVSLQYGYPSSRTCLINEETSHFPSLSHISMLPPQRPSSIWTQIFTESISHIYPASTSIRIYVPAQSNIIHKYDISQKYIWSQVV
jgi:hypothetical protein